MKNPNRGIATEACFVVANALTTCDLETMITFWQDYGDELVQAIFLKYLVKHLDFACSEKRILQVLFEAVEKIMETQQ